MSINIDRIIFRPVIADFAYLLEVRDQLIDIETLKKKERVLELAISSKKGQKKHYPIFSCKIRPANTSTFNPIYPTPILQNNDDGKVELSVLAIILSKILFTP